MRACLHLLPPSSWRHAALQACHAGIAPNMHPTWPPARPAVARKVRAGQDALAAGEAERALVLAEAACEGSVPAAEPAVRLRVEALLQLGRCGRGRVVLGGERRHGTVVWQLAQ